jgi:hypothetical protein
MADVRMRLFAFLLTLLFLYRIGATQATNARLKGVVRDPSGTVVSGAKVSI